MKAGLLLLLLVAAVTVSGCTADVNNGGTTEIKNNEIVVLENVEAVPSEVRPERNFVLSGFVTNKAGAKVNNVRIELADYCVSVFDATKTSCSLTTFEGYSGCVFSLNLDASSKFQWNFKAPPAGRTAGRDFDCNMIVKTNYSYTARGSTGVILANDAGIAARETGPSPVTGAGPVKIYITVETEQPVGKAETFDVKIILKNEGAGELEAPIPRESFRFNRPEGLSGGCDIPATITIPKTKKESDPIYCTFGSPSILPPRVTRFLTADADYSYKFSSSVPVKLSVVKQI
ncbi:MAG: hypothetical protein HYS53_01545 [Candidatus Aenigmarchaeota archaeon]|nr:hypothetical protein [Candidatus Aenigmarchaeota archaeon]